jgi:hypothetical protein
MSIGYTLQDPNATSFYQVEWTDYLAGAPIGSVAWSVSPTGPTISGDAVDGTIASCKLAGIEAGKFYTLTCRLTTAGGVIEDRSIEIRGAQR